MKLMHEEQFCPCRDYVTKAFPCIVLYNLYIHYSVYIYIALYIIIFVYRQS